jgi:hypothetical protein
VEAGEAGVGAGEAVSGVVVVSVGAEGEAGRVGE